MTLWIADPDATMVEDLTELPARYVTESVAIMAVKRAGKSNAAVVIAEELYNQRIPWVAIDPKGDWWGVRAAGDGEAPGLSVLVFGGEHADVPLEPSSGQLVADLVVDNRLTCVLDVSEMTKADQRRFLVAFAERLYRRNREPLHVFCEEADEYIPQMVRGESAKVVGAFETLVKRGGFRGIGVTLVTQRSASLNKDVLTQVGTLIVLRTTSPQDRKAVGEWIKYHAQAEETLAELATLHNGEAFVYSPEFLGGLQRTTFRRRRTFDSGATPEMGEIARTPATLAEVDLDAVRKAMAATIERAAADDPRALKAKIRDLEERLEIAETMRAVVEVPVFGPGEQAMLDTALRRFELEQQALMNAVERLHGRMDSIKTESPEPERVKLTSGVTSVPKPVFATAPNGPPLEMPSIGGRPLRRAERLILTALVQHGDHTKSELGILTGYAPGGGGFTNSLSSLRTKGHVRGSGVLTITETGVQELGTVQPLPTGQALVAQWSAKLGKAERMILEHLTSIYPVTATKEEIAKATEYAASGGGFTNALSHLRSMELINGYGEIRANDMLAL